MTTKVMVGTWYKFNAKCRVNGFTVPEGTIAKANYFGHLFLENKDFSIPCKPTAIIKLIDAGKISSVEVEQ